MHASILQQSQGVMQHPTLDNGFVLYNIPFYDGYFTDIGDPLICAYPGYPYPMIAFNFGAPMWEASGAQEDTKVCVTVTGEQEYILPELLLSMHYLDEKREGQSDESFANFRLISGGNIKPGMFYRSASPCDNVHNRSETTDRLMADAGIKTVLNLAESQEELTDLLDEYQEWNSNYARMAENGDVILMDLSSNYMTDIFAEKLGQGLLEMTKHEGPVLIHCQEGKDRTGFVCILLEMLAGSSYEEIEADYLKTYEEYFELDKETFPDAYNFYVEMRLLPIISFITGPMTDYVSGAEDYLKFCGLTDEEIQEIKDYVNQ